MDIFPHTKQRYVIKYHHNMCLCVCEENMQAFCVKKVEKSRKVKGIMGKREKKQDAEFAS